MGLLFGKVFGAPKVAVLAGTVLVATLAAPVFGPQLVLHAALNPAGKAKRARSSGRRRCANTAMACRRKAPGARISRAVGSARRR